MPGYVDASFQIGGFYLAYIYVSALTLRCPAGRSVRASISYKIGYSLRHPQNRTAAELIGIDVEKVSSITSLVLVRPPGGRRYGVHGAT